MRFERQEGTMLGSMTINMIVTFLACIGVVAAAMATTWPDVPVGPVIAVGVVTAIVVPLAFWPFAMTFWVAVELAMRPLEPDEQAEADAHANH